MKNNDLGIDLLDRLIDYIICERDKGRTINPYVLLPNLYELRLRIKDLPIADTEICCHIDKTVFFDEHIPETERTEHIKQICGENIGNEIMKNGCFLVEEEKRTNRIKVIVRVERK